MMFRDQSIENVTITVFACDYILKTLFINFKPPLELFVGSDKSYGQLLVQS